MQKIGRLLLALSLVTCMACSAEPPAQSESVANLREAAESGDADAQFQYALRLGQGEGIEQDQSQAFEWIRRAANGGSAAAQSMLGTLLIESEDKQTQSAGLEWLQKAAEQGDEMANMQLGMRAVDNDHTEQALEYLERAAANGDANTQLALANMHYDGEIAPADGQRALFWVQRSAQAGNAQAQRWLGAFYADGEFVERDLMAAYFWMTLSQRSGLAADSEPAVSEWLTPEARRQTHSLVDAWTLGKDAPKAPLHAGPPAPTSGYVVFKDFDYDSLENDPTPSDRKRPPSREFYWRVNDASAGRVDGMIEVLISEFLIRPSDPSSETARTLGIPSPHHLLLRFTEDGELESGILAGHYGGFVEIPAEDVQSELHIDAEGLSGRLHLPCEMATRRDCGMYMDVRFEAQFTPLSRPEWR